MRDRGRVAVPDAAMHHDAVADLDVVHVVADGIDDPRRVAAADMKIRMIVLGFLTRGDDVQRRAERSPHVVEVHPRRHHVNQHFVGADFRHGDLLDLECVPGVAESLRADYLRVHLFGHVPDRGHLADLVNFLTAHFNFSLFTTGGATRRRAAAAAGLPSPDSRFRSKTRAGLSYRFPSDKTILIFRGLGNGAIAAWGVTDRLWSVEKLIERATGDADEHLARVS